jgi:hypothetical protein
MPAQAGIPILIQYILSKSGLPVSDKLDPVRGERALDRAQPECGSPFNNTDRDDVRARCDEFQGAAVCAWMHARQDAGHSGVCRFFKKTVAEIRFDV